MARPAGFEPTTHGLDVPGTTLANNNLSHQHCAHTSHLRKTCKALQPMQSFVCPIYAPSHHRSIIKLPGYWREGS
ncbi:hypothetical protein DLB95_07015 [Salmonella enterica subsp. diarizonae]|uniref:Uncharacterized protein n=6 Tax=Salmonella enterica TaxID=28901 RepID=A0A3T3KV86_SALDZ|nr:hypothetical protein DOE63_30330 [Salmonella enterica subsp. diarizonae serovar 59:z10:-]AXC71385.1 hypothetical protein DOE59_07110 [Salmonella enterica subsp. diarizonae serovar 48:i:z]AXD08802.1 hypothetical protein CHE29_07430 [Salmonella enterica]EAA0678248.1 hypothetical protein [Salmonella enterica subsp. diarizonae]EAW1160685.1 hypothetical protein [Salmonella enterica subsp. enterica]EBE3717643.1 hypothetical protein [Salmonella enterica subsp. diarizonae serovar 42:l,v:1,5,7]EBH8